MPDRFNVQAGDWDTDANWATATGGAGGASYPAAGDDAILDDNSGNCTLDANAACDSLIIGQVGALYTGTLDAGSSDVAIGSGGLDCSYGSSATLDLGSGTWTITGGDFDAADLGTFTAGSSDVQFSGVCAIYPKQRASSADHYWDVTVNAGATLTYPSSATDDWRTNNDVTVNGSLDIQTGNQLRVGGSLSIGAAGDLFGSGRMEIWSPADITAMDGRLRCSRLIIYYWLAGGTPLPAGDYECPDFQFRLFIADNTFRFGAGTFSFVDLKCSTANVGTQTIDFGTNNPTVTIGDLTIGKDAAGGVVFVSSSNALTVSGDITDSLTGFGGTFTADSQDITDNSTNDNDWDGCGGTWGVTTINKSAGTLTFSGAWNCSDFVGTDGNLNINGQTITASGAVSFASGFTLADATGATLACDTVSFDGQTVTGLTINATTSGTATGTTFTNCNASGEVEIDASDGTCVDGGGNSGIDFGGVNRRRRLLMACGA